MSYPSGGKKRIGKRKRAKNKGRKSEKERKRVEREMRTRDCRGISYSPIDLEPAIAIHIFSTP